MTRTPEDLVARIRAYYDHTTTQSYLASWSPEALSMHLGRDGEGVDSHHAAFLNANRHLADILDVRVGARALDIGCGVGGTSMWMAAERGAEVTGVNVVPQQIELARRVAQERGVSDRVRFIEADCQETGLPCASYDVAWNQESFCHVHDARALFRHLGEVLVAGGRYAITDYFRGATTDDRLIDTLCDGWALPGLRTLDETAALLRDAGFEQVSVTIDTQAVMNSAIIMRNMASRRRSMIELEKLMRGVTEPIYEGHTIGSIACVDGLLNGSIVYGVVVAHRPCA